MATPTIPTIPANASLYTVWQRTVYTERRLQRNKLTVDLAPPFAVLASRCKIELVAQLDHWGAEIGAQAAVDEADDALDDTTNEIVAEVKHLDRKTNNARLKRYLGKSTGSGVVRLGLASQLKVMRTWPGALASEPEASLKSLGERLAGDITVGTAADDERATHRARNITSLIDDLNALRTTTLGRLVVRATKNKLPSDWPRRFFFRARTQANNTTDSPEPDGPTG